MKYTCYVKILKITVTSLVCINKKKIGMHGNRQCDGRRVGRTPSERSDIPCIGKALKTCHNHDATFFELAADPIGFDVGNAG